MNINEIAEIIGVKYSGHSFEITGINTLKNALSHEISFLTNPKYFKELHDSHAGAILVTESVSAYVPTNAVTLIVDDPYLMMAKLTKYFAPQIEDLTMPKAIIGEGSRISSKAEIANGAIIGKNCTLLAGVYVGSQCVIGDNTTLYPNVVVYRDCKIGSNCIIHANTTIGSDGFGFATNKMGEHTKIYQNGNVIIEDDVEIGSSTTIDRAVFNSTIIKKGVRIDNLVQIGHNCEIGEYSVLVAQTGLAGSSKLGRNVVMGGQSATSGHLEIASFNTFAARSGVTKSITSIKGTYAGFPLMEHKLWLKLQGKLARLIK
jgi:UDP-3-O-[3-hydroxymyristoyl] glucosamine N-acyltransferase